MRILNFIRHLRPEVRLALGYFVAGFAWITLSDQALHLLLGNAPELLTLAQTYKGWLFILVTTLLLYVFLRREFDHRREIENRLVQSEHDFRYLFRNNPRPMWVYDLNTLVFVDVNLASVTQYGYTRDEFLSMTIKDIRPAEDIPKLMEALTRNRSNLEFSGAWRHRRKDGSVLDVEIVSHKLHFGGFAAALVLAEDVTEIKKLQGEAQEKVRLQMALDRETESRELRRRFMAMLGHEFRTPLTTIFSSAEMLDHYDDRLPVEARKLRYNEIRQQVERSIEMLDDFLMMMRAESVGPQFNPAPVDLVAFCRAIVQEFETAAHNLHTLRFSNSTPSAMIYADEKLLRHALCNLIANAIKYSPQGGSIDVEIGCDPQQCYIRIHDQGIGIPPEDVEQLFEIFHRASNVGSIPGTGLGLAITRQAVELHSGRLEVESTAGSGSTFTIRLPLTNTDHA